jgi:3-oxoacyl-[acyl-carrier protein] reductase
MLAGKTVFVSGGTGYIGSEICRTLHSYGTQIIFSYYRNKEKAKELQQELEGVKSIELNLRDVKGIEEKMGQLYKEVEKIDVLVNNAGISQVLPLALLEEEDVDLVLEVNMKGTLFLTKAVVKGMIRNKSGNIISLGSIAGQRILDVPLTYAMTKASISGFTFALAAELKKFGIRVNSVIPGLMEGGVAKGVPEDLKNEFIKHCAARRAGTAKDVAELVGFLASDKSDYINGQNISVDGGI